MTQFNEVRLNTNTKGLTVLGTWAAGNLAIGSIMMTQTKDEAKYFHQMNAAWGGINLAIAGFGYFNALSADPSSFSLLETINEQHSIQKILMLNIGLDAAYMLGGAYMIERSKTNTENPLRLSGFGKSIVMQGAFLFVFDIGFYIAHNLNNPKLEPFLSGLTFTGNGFHFAMNF
ncbi:MAG: hypothetical protein AB8G11_21215 [Saprospiraceae bacterium]